MSYHLGKWSLKDFFFMKREYQGSIKEYQGIFYEKGVSREYRGFLYEKEYQGKGV
jgi:hypothetical protein